MIPVTDCQAQTCPLTFFLLSYKNGSNILSRTDCGDSVPVILHNDPESNFCFPFLFFYRSISAFYFCGTTRILVVQRVSRIGYQVHQHLLYLLAAALYSWQSLRYIHTKIDLVVFNDGFYQ